MGLRLEEHSSRPLGYPQAVVSNQTRSGVIA